MIVDTMSTTMPIAVDDRLQPHNVDYIENNRPLNLSSSQFTKQRSGRKCSRPQKNISNFHDEGLESEDDVEEEEMRCGSSSDHNGGGSPSSSSNKEEDATSNNLHHHQAPTESCHHPDEEDHLKRSAAAVVADESSSPQSGDRRMMDILEHYRSFIQRNGET